VDSRPWVQTIKDYYEQVWERLPDELEPPDVELRRRFLHAGVRRGDRALDLGCGTGVFTAELADAGAAAIGVEVAEAAIARARTAHPQIDFRLAPLDGPLPLEDRAVDLVWASEVIEHVADTERWLREVARVLAPGGRLLVTTPNHPRLALATRGIERYSEPLGDHLHLYTRRSLTATLTELGFERVEVRGAGGIPLLKRLLLARALGPAT
jgi:2-polyprenyl-6-hydroxyphenyl methylase/3-demethylubiquinone-9 3-methyltransferase